MKGNSVLEDRAEKPIQRERGKRWESCSDKGMENERRDTEDWVRRPMIYPATVPGKYISIEAIFEDILGDHFPN